MSPGSYYTDRGEVITVSSELGRGGEGAVFEIARKRDICAKIYLKEISPELRRKLSLMVSNPPQDPTFQTRGHRSIVWPQFVLYQDPGKKTARGFSMPRIDTNDFQTVFKYVTPSSRIEKYGGGFTWKYLLTVGLNISSALAALHERDYCVGDINESNILVSPKTLITVIDCDSFQVKDKNSGQVFRCKVGKPEFTAPELQGRPFDSVDRTTESDCFALAVLIFQLLMQGTHPFQAKGRLVNDSPTPESKIVKGLYPYASNKPSGLEPPDYAPPIELLSRELQQMFVRCFVDGQKDRGKRPSAKEWFETLRKSKTHIRTCTQNQYHAFLDHCSRCPWCELAARNGDDPFPSPVGQQVLLADPTQGIATLDQRVGSLRAEITMALADNFLAPEEENQLFEYGKKLKIPRNLIRKTIDEEIQRWPAYVTRNSSPLSGTSLPPFPPLPSLPPLPPPPAPTVQQIVNLWPPVAGVHSRVSMLVAHTRGAYGALTSGAHKMGWPAFILAVMVTLFTSGSILTHPALLLLSLGIEILIVLALVTQESFSQYAPSYTPSKVYNAVGGIMAASLLLFIVSLPVTCTRSVSTAIFGPGKASETPSAHVQPVPVPQPATSDNDVSPNSASPESGTSRSLWQKITDFFQQHSPLRTTGGETLYLGRIVNLRDGPSVHARIIAKLVPPTEIRKLNEQKGEWVRVESLGKSGWVFGQGNMFRTQIPEVYCTTAFSFKSLRVRVNPSPDASSTWAIGTKQQLRYLGTSQDGLWGNIRRSDGREGWVLQRYLKVQEPG